jgi:hypothetical protein
MAIWQHERVKVILNKREIGGIQQEIFAHGIAEATHNVMLEEIELMTDDIEAHLS